MREKRLRKQEMEQNKTSAEAEASQKPTPARTLRSSAPSSSTPTPDTTSSIQQLPLRKLKSKAASPLNNSVTPGTTTGKQSENGAQRPSSSTEVTVKDTRNSSRSPVKHVRAAPQGPTDEAAAADKPLNNLKTSPKRTTDTKGMKTRNPVFFC